MQVFSTDDPAHNKLAQKTREKNTFYSRKTKSFMHFFNIQELKLLFRGNKILEIKKEEIKDNHPPSGRHDA